MIRGVYTSATGMIAHYKKLDVIGNDIANMETPGFKRDGLTLKQFDEELIVRMSDGTAIGSASFGVAASGMSTDLTQGVSVETDLSTDLEINGEGFFAVLLPNGETAYTRNGNFTVDTDGYLALPGGQRLLDTNGQPIYTGGTDFTVAGDGTLTTAAGTRQIAVYNGQAVKRNDGLFNLANAALWQESAILQGRLESSNTDAATEMTGMMASSRAFQSNQQAFKVANETLDKLISEVGSL
jgi:flagellar basal-body rod protein FlgF